MIDETFNFISKLSERGVSDKIKLLLSIVFVGSITSFAFERFYFRYELIDLKEYAKYYDFFIKGYFLIPSILFFIIWFFTEFLSYIFFRLPSMGIANCIRKQIEKISLSDLSVFDYVEKKFEASVEILNDKISSNWVMDLILVIGEKMAKNENKTRYLVKIGVDRMQREFTFITRTIVAIIFYYNTLDSFDNELFIIAIAVMMAWGSLFILTYQLIAIIQTLSTKIPALQNEMSRIK